MSSFTPPNYANTHEFFLLHRLCDLNFTLLHLRNLGHSLGSCSNRNIAVFYPNHHWQGQWPWLVPMPCHFMKSRFKDTKIKWQNKTSQCKHHYCKYKPLTVNLCLIVLFLFWLGTLGCMLHATMISSIARILPLGATVLIKKLILP